jgi:hypothetical protein
MPERLADDVSPAEARHVFRMVRAYQGLQEAAFHMERLLEPWGILIEGSDGTRLNNDRVLALYKRQKEDQDAIQTGG